MIQVNRIYLIFNRLVTKKFLVDTSDLLITLAGEVYPGNQALLWIGVVVIIVAICICGKAYGKMSASQASTPKKVSYWLLWQDWPSCFSMDWL